VWKARDTRLDRIVAIKRLRCQHSARFDQEARAIAALNHPHICQIYDVGPDYLVLEYVEGHPIRGRYRWTRQFGWHRKSLQRWRRRTAKGSSIGI